MAPTALSATASKEAAKSGRATTVHTAVTAKPTKFKHPLDPLTPDEVSDWVPVVDMISFDSHTPDVDQCSVSSDPALYHHKYTNQGRSLHHLLFTPAAEESRACVIGHPSYTGRPARGAHPDREEGRE